MQLFISDLHLHDSRPETSQLFFDFIAGPAQSTRQLFILGDLFEYWAGDDDIATPLHGKVVTAIKSLAERGVGVNFIVGNRDFLIGDRFAVATGARLLPDPDTQAIGGISTVLLHGDTLCSDDIGYQQFRQQVRDPAFIKDFLQRPLAERKAYIENLRARSESEKQIKSALIMDVNQDTVQEAMSNHHCLRLIHGHTHRPNEHNFVLDNEPAQRFVLAAWTKKAGEVLCCNREGFKRELI